MKRNRITGIYLITCLFGKYAGYNYVGQAYNIKLRWSGHIYDCKTKNHCNHIIQYTYTKYGEKGLRFSLLKPLDPFFVADFTKTDIKKILTPMEQVYLTAFDIFTNANICREASTCLGVKQSDDAIARRVEKICKTFTLYHPTHGTLTFKNLDRFASDRNLHAPGLHGVVSGVSYTSQGYYKSEEYYLDRSKWEKDYPSKTSEFPGVKWSRQYQAWETVFRHNNTVYYPGVFKDEFEAFVAIEAFREKHNLPAQLTPYELYSPKEGYLKGDNLYKFTTKRSLNYSSMKSLLKGHIYSSYGFYKTELYYLDKKQWEKDYPQPKSKHECVYWNPGLGKWRARVNVRGENFELGNFTLEEEANEVVQRFLFDNGIRIHRYRSCILYSTKTGYLSLEEILELLPNKKIDTARLMKVANGTTYTAYEFYKNKDYCENRSIWKKENPSPISSYKGVRWQRREENWLANPTVEGLRVYLGTFSDENKAIEACENYRNSLISA